MFTAFCDPSHMVSSEIEMPTHVDALGDGVRGLRRKQTRALRRFEIAAPDSPERLDSLIGLLEHVQGDTPFWFDGADFGEIFEPILIGTGDGSKTDFDLPHRHVFVSSAVIYLNDALLTAWTPLGDGVTMQSFRCTAAPAANAQLKAKYRRKFKVRLETEEATLSINQEFTDRDDPSKSFYAARYVLQEVAV